MHLGGDPGPTGGNSYLTGLGILIKDLESVAGEGVVCNAVLSLIPHISTDFW